MFSPDGVSCVMMCPTEAFLFKGLGGSSYPGLS